MTDEFERANASPRVRSEIPLWPVALFLALGSFAFLVDLPVALWFKHSLLPRVLRDLIEKSEAFAHGASVAVILAGCYILDRSNRKHLLRLIIMAYGSGLITDSLKLTVERIRPRDFSFAGDVWTTFQGWLPLLTHTSRQSFPSSHAAVAVGLAIGLAVVYPSARGYFALLAVLACLQRLQCGAHYPSDVLFAAAVAWAFCWWLHRYGMPMQRVPSA